MKTVAKTKPTRAARRDLFAELGEGMTALAEARSGKRTLRTYAIEYKPAPKVTPKELIHEYGEIDYRRLYAIATQKLPGPIQALQHILGEHPTT